MGLPAHKFPAQELLHEQSGGGIYLVYTLRVEFTDIMLNRKA